MNRAPEQENCHGASRASALSLGTVLFVAILGHLTLFPKVADLDAFYHIGHAAAYLEGSLFDSSLPWATQSIIGDRGADMWWGFHMLLTPFAAIADVELAIRIAAFVLTLSLAGVFTWVLRRHGVVGPGWWTALFLLAVPNVFFRHLMVRPHMVSLALSLVLLSFLVRGRWWQAAAASAAITWVHLSLFWMAPGIVIAYALVRMTERLTGLTGSGRGVPVASGIWAVFLGAAAGWLLRPHPVDAAALANVQIIRLFAQKATEEPLLFASELLPLPVMELLRTSWLFSAAWVLSFISLVVYARRQRLAGLLREERTLLLTSLLISVVFLLLTVTSARRAIVQWVAFGFVALPILWTYVVSRLEKRAVRSLVTVIVMAHFAWGARRHMLNVHGVAFAAGTLSAVAEFLESSSEPGEVVFHARWDNFGPLFARNRTNLYLGGMDPIFQFAHNPRAYWEFFYLSADINTEWTCDAFPCASGVATDTHQVLREHFGARWVVVEPGRNPRLSLYFLNDPRFELALETQGEAVFEVLENYPLGMTPTEAEGDATLPPPIG